MGLNVITIAAWILVIRKAIAVAIQYIVYPATLDYIAREGQGFSNNISGEEFSNDLKGNNFSQNDSQLTKIRKKEPLEDEVTSLKKGGYVAQRITISKSGKKYNAWIVGKPETLKNGHWIQAAGGNGYIGEDVLCNLCDRFKIVELKCNLLYVDGPGVGRLLEYPTTYGMGAAQEAGLQFLENAIKAKRIFMYGTSLGGGSQAEGILAHEFNKKVKYMVQSDRTFDTLSHAASEIVKEQMGLPRLAHIVEPLFWMLGISLNGVAGAKKLQKLNIPHIVTQNNNNDTGTIKGVLPYEGKIDESGTDQVIANAASLYVGVRKANINDNERVKFFGHSGVRHNGSLPYDVSRLVQKELTDFFKE
jgi:hypothetical protein